jgi:choice-of-anchor C domain-containing protein
VNDGSEDGDMRVSNKISIMVATLATLVVAADPALVGANGATVTNAGFEKPVVIRRSHRFEVTDLRGWSVPSGNIDILTSRYWQPHSGRQSIDLAGCASGTIRQRLATTPGQTFELSYWIAGNVDTVGVRTAMVSVGSTAGETDLATKSESFDTTGKTHRNMGWERRSVMFTAISATSWIQFTDTSTSRCQGVALDDIDVRTIETPVVPESPLVVLLPLTGLAIGGATFAASKRRRGVSVG